MRKYLIVSVTVYNLLCACRGGYAEDYAECRARCAQELTDCMNEPQAPEPEVETAREGACSQRAEHCIADCENLKPAADDTQPKSSPNIIWKADRPTPDTRTSPL